MAAAAGVQQMDEEFMLRNIKQFAQVNNELSERCFNNCVGGISSRELSTDEFACVESCAAKLVRASTHVVVKVAELNPAGMGQQQQPQATPVIGGLQQNRQ